MINDEFVKNLMQERPVMVTLDFNGKEMVDFKVAGAWMRNPKFNILTPYPSSPTEAMEYVASFVEDIEIVPYDNLAGLEEKEWEAKAAMVKLLSMIREAKHTAFTVDTETLTVSVSLVVTP